MGDKPETSSQGNETKKEEKESPQIASLGSFPALTGQAQAEDAKNPVQYRSYIAWPFKAIWWLIRWLLKFFDDNQGAVTAIATMVIAYLTYQYVINSREQVRLEKAVDRLAYGAPFVNVRPDWTGLYNVAEGKKLQVTFALQNDGKRNAEDMYGAINVEFLPHPPVPKFAAGDFRHTEPYVLVPFVSSTIAVNGPYATLKKEFSEPISPEQYAAYKAGNTKLYIWGEFVYGDFTGQKTLDGFCLYISSTEVPTAGDGPKGYSGPYSKCQTNEIYPKYPK
jgi:hypothetical protein